MPIPNTDLTIEDAEPDRYRVFAKLREIWKKVDKPVPGTKDRARNSSSLAEYLNTPKQRVTQWATGSGGKGPAPWWVIMLLCHELGFGIALHPKQGMKLYRLKE